MNTFFKKPTSTEPFFNFRPNLTREEATELLEAVYRVYELKIQNDALMQPPTPRPRW